MKKLSWMVLLVLLVLLPFVIEAQSRLAEELIDQIKVDTVHSVALEEDGGLVYLPFEFGKSEIVSLPEGTDFKDQVFEGATLVYSGFPKNIGRIQKEINVRRIRNLLEKIPVLQELSSENWKAVIQTGAENIEEANQLFHGFILQIKKKSKIAADIPNFLDESGLYFITKGDSTVHKIFTRNKDWKNMLVVTDLTGSMAPFTAQLLLWLKLNERKRIVNYFVFFNDGDMSFEEDKKIGKTGGIYSGGGHTFEEVAQLAQQTATNGSGGDYQENDLEAVIHGINSCQECEDVIIIADNRASPRDMVLLPKITKPVRVILCGTADGINPDYLNVALKTGGSVHTIEEDLQNLVKLNEGQAIRIGKEVFVIKNGKFEYLKKM